MSSEPDRTPAAPYAARLRAAAGATDLALCAGIDPSPDAIALLLDPGPSPTGATVDGRRTRAAAMERFGGMVVEAVRDHAVAVKPQLAWFESAGAPGLRALERVVDYARRAGLLVVLDGKRGDVPHSAAVYADAWLGEAAGSGIRGDALTVNAAIGADALAAMAEVAAARGCALYALVLTSNPGAARLQGAELRDGTPWWHELARAVDAADTAAGGGVVGAVVGATHGSALVDAASLLRTAPLLVPGIGAQGGELRALLPLAGRADAPPTLVNASRSLLPRDASTAPGFRFAVSAAARELAGSLAATCSQVRGAPSIH